MNHRRRLLSAVIILAGLAALAAPLPAASADPASKGQTIYLPLYSHVYYGDREREFNLTATAYVRNMDRRTAITVTTAEYYSNKGKRLKSLIEKPIRVAPFASVNWTIKESDTTGGSGASVMVRWVSDQAVTPPLVEAVMIGAASTQGISFVCQGRVIEGE
jgi:hypothetical protein